MHLSKISLALRQWGAGAGFSPLDLFSSGEQGAWYDPSDINNYMGPELIVNGTFDSNTDGWIPIEATASVVGGKCVVTNTSNTWGFVTTELQVTVGDTYALSIYFDTTSGYDAAVGIPGLLEDYISAGQTITYSATVVADTNPLTLIIGNADEVVGHNISFDNVSIRRIGEATMFQDAAGTTPVTADGQPVGLILDKSKGLALGPELAPDWDLLGGGAGWFVDPEFTIANGVAVGVVSVKSNNKYLYPEIINTEIGKVYEATFVVTEVTGRFHIFVWDGTTDINFKLDIPDPGSYSLIFRANSTSGYYPYIDLLEPARVVVESISVKELAGNHAVAPSDAARPLKTSTGLSDWINYDAVDDVLNITFQSSLGSSCTVCRANVGAAPTILTAQTIGTSYADSTDHAGLIIIDRALTAQETTDVTAWLLAKGATA